MQGGPPSTRLHPTCPQRAQLRIYTATQRADVWFECHLLAQVDELVGDACGRDEFVVLVIDFDVVARGGSAEVGWCAHSAHPPGNTAAVVGDVEVHAYGGFPLEP